MPNTLVRVYDNLAAAQHAREQLLASGFASDHVHLDSTVDEAGPVEGNSVLDDKDTGKGPRSGPLYKFFNIEERTDAYNNSEPVWRSCYLLTVDADDDAESARASDIMDSTGARSIDKIGSRRRES